MKTYLIIGAAFLLLCGGWFVSCKVQQNKSDILALQLQVAKDSIQELQTPVLLHADTIIKEMTISKTSPADTVFSSVRDTVWKSDTTAKVYTGSDSTEFLTARWKIVATKLYSKQFTYNLRQQVIEKNTVYYRDKLLDRPVETPKVHLRAFAGFGQNNSYFGGAEFQSAERWGLIYQYNTGNHQGGITYRIF